MAANYHLRDITQQIFEQHPNAHLNEHNEPVVPAGDLFDILNEIADRLGGGPILSEYEQAQFIDLCTNNQGLECTPQLLWQLVEQRSNPSPSSSPDPDDDRGRRLDDYDNSHSRSHSNESYGGRISRPPSRGSTTPFKSPLDSERRQRSTPLNTIVPPSSWSRPSPHHRRKSDAGNRSDSESQASPSAWATRTSRSRAPSNPTSPSPGSSSNNDYQFPPPSPDFSRPPSRPASRGGHNSNYEYGYMSNDDNNNQTVKRRPRSRYGGYNDSFDGGVSTLPMPRTAGEDSDDDEMDDSLVHERQPTISMISMEEHERMEALQRANEELTRKLSELRDTLERRISEHEQDMHNSETRLEELRSELATSNRDEKELRAKDLRNMTQIAALETAVAKTAKALELSKSTYSSLQKQYQEQTTLSERYREDIRRRDDQIRSLKDTCNLQELEISKWVREHEIWEERVHQLEDELSSAIEAHSQLDEQKHENLLLKETIDRMRFEIDTMRDAAISGTTSGMTSAANTISKSLGAELQGKMNWDLEEDQRDDSGDLLSEGSTIAEEGEDTEGEEEDIIQTIITKKKRKVASRASIIETRRTFEEMKEYSDGATQYDPTLFCVNHGMQTEPEYKPQKTSFSIQTDEMPEPKPLPLPTPRITVEMETQTDTMEEEVSPQHDESLASSSSTVVPVADIPTPKAKAKMLDPLDEPPTYNQATEEEREVDAALAKWHGGARFPFNPVAGGISEETLEEWKALKQELGVDCQVIDKIIANTLKAAGPSTAGSSSSRRDEKLPARRSRFYNIYNTYVYGEKSSSSLVKTIVTQGLMVVGASALVMMVLSPQQAHHYSIPGGATYYDRAAWSSFNTMGPGGEGFGPDGTAAVWDFLGRVGGGAARIARGWPT